MDHSDEFDPLAVVFPVDEGSAVGVRSRAPATSPPGAPGEGGSSLAPTGTDRGGTVAAVREPYLRVAPAAFPFDPILKPVFRDFEQAGVRWCLLGAPVRLPGRPGEELTALVERPALATAKAVLQANGFAPIPVWATLPGGPAGGEALPRGEGTARYTGYNRATGRWVTLFLAVRLTFGDYGAFETGAERGCLERRRWQGGVYLLAPDDAFWARLLHLLLDAPGATPPEVSRLQPVKRTARPLAAFAALERLAVEARTDGPLARLVGGLLPAGWAPEHIVDCVWEGEWDVLRSLGAGIEEAWRRQRTWAARRRAFKCRLAHRMSSRRQLEGFLTGPQGFTVALLAPDLAGKAALARDLGRTFYLPVTHVRMGPPPPRPGRAGRLVRAGFFRTLRASWHCYGIGRLRRARGRLVIFDRYTFDARLPARVPPKGLARLRRFILGRACPAPDLVVVLDAPALYSSRRARAVGRGPGTTDLSPGALRRQYLDLAQRIPDAVVAEARGGDEELRREVTDQVWRAYAAAPPPAWLRCARRLRRPWQSGA
jgi:hypothetical protein